MAAALPLGSLNRARYAGLDFDTHNDDLQARLQVKYAADFNDFAVSSLGIMLLDLTAYGLDTLSFYLDRRATDQYLATARSRKSVARTSRQLGYKMGGAVSSSVDVEVSVNEVHAFDVPVPAGFQLDGEDGVIFEVAEETLFTIAEQGLTNSKFLPCYEGRTFQEVFTSDGTPSQVFELRRAPEDEFIVQGSVEVTVDGADWEENDLLEYGATDQFEVGYNDEPPTLRTGDGIAGNIPGAGASVRVTYVVSRGKAGRVPRETIQQETTKLVVAFTEIALTINNPEGSTGGDDRETLASAKAFAPKVWKSRDVAVTGEDYEGHAGSYADPLFGRVAVAKAISSRSAASDITVQNYLIAIETAVAALNTSLTAATTAIDASLDIIDADVTGLTSDQADATSASSDIETEKDSALASVRSIKNYTGEITVDAADIGNYVTSGKSAVAASSATVGEKATIDGWFDLIDVEQGNIATASGNAESLANSSINNLNAITTALTDLGVALVSIGTHTTSIGAESAAIRTQTATIDTANATLVALVDLSDEDSASSGINTHLDKLLAADCKANLVTVPILVRDAGGFYTAPSSGLIDSLQNDLDAKKEVTQTVAVTSGVNFLIPAVITARVGVLPNFSEAVVKTAVEAVIDGVLRDRKFGVPLYESDLDDPILEVEGVDFVNARITGHLDTDGTTVLTTRLDSDGNLIILDSEIISRGTTTVTTELVTNT
jgi:hypothetical protein